MFTIQKASLLPALKAAASAAGRVSPHDLILVKPTETGALLVCGDGDRFLSLPITATTSRLWQPFATAAKHFSQVVAALPDGLVTITPTAKRIEVAGGPAHYGLNDADPTVVNFPEIPPEALLVSMTADEWEAMGAIVAPACPKDDTRYGLNGLHLDKTETCPLWVATDGTRLSGLYLHEQVSAWPKNRLLPLPVVSAVQALLGMAPSSATVELRQSENWIVAQVKADGALVSSCAFRPVDGEFPPWRSVMPCNREPVPFDHERFLQALKRVSLEATDRAHTVRLSRQPDATLLSARNLDQGEARERIEGQILPESLASLGTNATYLEHACRIRDAQISFGGPLDPIQITGTAPGSNLRAFHIVMPIRLD